MANNKERYWFVFCSSLSGYSVTPKKLTLEEFESAYFSTKIDYNFLDKLGFCYHENFISGYYYSPSWTQKEAWKIADSKNLELYKSLKQEIKNIAEEEF